MSGPEIQRCRDMGLIWDKNATFVSDGNVFKKINYVSLVYLLTLDSLSHFRITRGLN